MDLTRKRSIYKKIAVFVAINMLVQLTAPTAAFALSSPKSPEAGAFERVSTTDMVNEFTGDFVYNVPVVNIPGPNGAGYALSISYHSGGSPEKDASWVGANMTLNPGSIDVGVRGFPDTWNGSSVKYWNKTKPNETVSIGGSIGNFEAYSYDPIPVNLNASVSYNTNMGFSYNAGAGVSLGNGVVSLGYSVSNGEGSFSLRVNPAGLFKKKQENAAKAERKDKEKIDKATNETEKAAATVQAKKNSESRKAKAAAAETAAAAQTSGDKRRSAGLSALKSIGSGFGTHDFIGGEKPTNITAYIGSSFKFTASMLTTPSPLQLGFSGSLYGSYSVQTNPVVADSLLAYGYMHSEDAGVDDMMDYFVENGSSYNKRDKTLGIPFNNADNYSVNGEGVSGTFRMYNRKAGHYHPNYKESVTDILNIGAEFEAGLNFGGGGDVGIGEQTLKVERWHSLYKNGFATEGSEDEAKFFRFAGDMGGSVEFDGGNVSPKQGAVSVGNVNVSAIEESMNEGRSQRSSYIGYSTNSEMKEAYGGVNYRRYSKDPTTFSLADRDDDDQIGEFSVVNEDGNRYNYGLPVLGRNEKDLQVDLTGVESPQIHNRYLVERDISDPTIHTKLGQERNATYVKSYLLTEITTSDFIDVDGDGADFEEDFGGVTKFEYEKIYGSGEAEWYRWRVPYAGLSYNRNSLSDPFDDLGSVSSGEREGHYLKKVETGTHYALFFTGPRNDGYGAAADPAASNDITAIGSQGLKRLDRIEVFAKSPDGNPANDELVSTTYFKYNYEIYPGITNSIGSSPDDGQLTLKEFYTEYNGVVEAEVNSYKFNYTYPTTAYPAPYGWPVGSTEYLAGEGFNNYADVDRDGTTDLIEDPSYSYFLLDPWGNYQDNYLDKAADRFSNMQTWVDQNPDINFDPAAWQLKSIILPSRAQIDVQYGRDTYTKVQNKQAHALVSMTSGGVGSFTLDVADDLGLDADQANDVADLIKRLYVGTDKKMYFKILYKLVGESGDQVYINDCNVDYITGYADVETVNVAGTVIQITLTGTNLPKDVCQDFVTTQRAGSLTGSGSNCDPADGIPGDDALAKVDNFMDRAETWLKTFDPTNTCVEINPSLSYLRIPVLEKKAGGLRVERILMYDEGVDAGYPVLYGTEYLYEVYDEDMGEMVSSGVATNEPGSLDEENPLVTYLERFEQTFANKVIAGEDKKKAVGPIGKSIYPGASVGYSRVVSKSIHSGKTNPGFTVKQFYTAKDFPIKYEMTKINKAELYLPIYAGLVNVVIDQDFLSQGFAFYISSAFNGKIRSMATYGGDYADINNPEKENLVSSEQYTYFKPGAQLPILNTRDLTYGSTMPLGKEMDLIFESKRVIDENIDGNLEVDADAGIFGVFVLPFGSGFPSLNFLDTRVATHVTTKIINYPAVVSSVLSYADGIYHKKENVAFNPENGQPIMTRTTDGFDGMDLLAFTDHDGTYASYTFPASLEYDNTSQKAKNERKVIATSADVRIDKDIIDSKAYLTFSSSNGSSVCGMMDNFVSGDLIKLVNYDGLYHIGAVSGSQIEIQPTNYSVLGGALGPVSVEIVRSGRTNNLNANVGSITTYGYSEVTQTPIAPAIMADRQVVADLLNTSMATGNPITYSDFVAAGAVPQILDGQGGCGDFPSDQFIQVEGSDVNVYQETPPLIGYKKTFYGLDREVVHSVRNTSDGGVIIAGDILGVGYDFFAMKLDASGNEQWTKKYSGSFTEEGSHAIQISQTSDAGYILYGYDFILKLDANGVITWKRQITGGNGFSITDILETSAGDYLACGASSGGNLGFAGTAGNFYLTKLSSAGVPLWTKDYVDSRPTYTMTAAAFSIVELSANSYILVGKSTDKAIRGKVMNVDGSGMVLWNKNYGEDMVGDNDWNVYSDAIKLSDGNVLLVGYINSGSTGVDILLTKIDPAGAVLWSQKYGEPGIDFGADVKEGSSGELYIAAYSHNVNDPLLDNCEQVLITTDNFGVATEIQKVFAYTENNIHSNNELTVSKLMDLTSTGEIVIGRRAYHWDDMTIGDIDVVKMPASDPGSACDIEEVSLTTSSPPTTNFNVSVTANSAGTFIDPAITGSNLVLSSLNSCQGLTSNLLCTSPIKKSGGDGNFAIDATTGQLVYYTQDNPCNGQLIPCLTLCPEEYPVTGITNVVASSASTLSESWDYDISKYYQTIPSNSNEYELGKKGKWRTESTYAYEASITSGKNYDAGLYTLQLFNWQNMAANPSSLWKKLNTVTKYSPNGNAIEEQNILGIKSSAKFGYNKTLAYLVAQNADYNSVMFESFENTYKTNTYLEDGLQLDAADGLPDNTTSHSGKQSFKLLYPENDGLDLSTMSVTQQMLDNGLSVKMWVKTDHIDRSTILNNMTVEMNLNGGGTVAPVSFIRVSQVGEWYLYQAKITPADLTTRGVLLDNTLKFFIKHNYTLGAEQIWVDDVRIQPMDAQMTAYVYDVVTHRLLTTFNDQHFGVYYQYNAKGQLVRKLIETPRGMKTVTETQYNTPKTPRPPW